MEDGLSGKTVTSLSERKGIASLVPPAWEHTVRMLGLDESRQAGLSLAHAFATDELSRYLVDTDDMADRTAEQKWKLHVDIMIYAAAAHCLSGEVTAIGPDHEGVALWLPPGKTNDDWWTILRSGMWRLYYQLSAEGRRRYYDEFLPLLHHTKQDVMGDRDDDCYYLVYIGTKPNARRRGYATKLLEHMIARADAENRAMYLESSSLANNAYYAKCGFEFKKDIFFHEPGGPPVTLSIMVREPRPPRVPAYSAKLTVKVQPKAVHREFAAV
ncbi:acetyltransferase [Plectosphaerella cucumerina]|uniref:Acetyltransferase n=1 Tax=Plectosphaerella cucumerina TaxID=40658 RepID=A0A8K0WYC5_9PEZI|nr:acetyltransferase [Plectosphaerella cucumerina]